MNNLNSVKQLNTPCVIVNEDVVKNNCLRMIKRAKELGVEIRPHMKTHKTIEIGKYQIEGLGYEKIIVSTLSEAQFFAKEFKDILYAIPISINKLDQAFSIHRSITRLTLMVDHIDHIESLVRYLNDQPSSNQKPWSVFLKIDCGYHRAGADPNSESTVNLVRLITDKYSKYFEFQGIYSHSGHSYKCQNAKEIAELAITEASVTGAFGKKLKFLGLPCPIVSIGSTPVCSNLPDNLSEFGVNEIHPGNYVFFDLIQVELGNCSIEDVGVYVLGTVLSVYPERNEMLVDAGSLALSSDPGCTHLKDRITPNYGVVLNDINLRIVSVTQEMGKIQSSNGTPIPFEKYPIGSKIKIIPNHSCLTAAMFSNYQIVNNQQSDSIINSFVPNKHW